MTWRDGLSFNLEVPTGVERAAVRILCNQMMAIFSADSSVRSAFWPAGEPAVQLEGLSLRERQRRYAKNLTQGLPPEAGPDHLGTVDGSHPMLS